MKRLICLFLCATVLVCSGCAEKKKDVKGTSPDNKKETPKTEEIVVTEPWQDAYAEFLRKIMYDREEYHYMTPLFQLAYVNDDDIPELVVIYGTAHFESPYLYTYYEGEVIPVNHEGKTDEEANRYGVYGAFIYKERANKIYIADMHMGYESVITWKLNDDMTAARVHYFNNNEAAVPEKEQFEYYVDDEKVTKEEYDEMYAAYEMEDDYTNIDPFANNVPELNEDNIVEVLGVERAEEPEKKNG